MRAGVTITHLPYTEGVKDAHGNPVESWGPPRELSVFAVYPTSSTEPDNANRTTLVSTGLSVLAPPMEIDPRDRFVWQGETWEVVGWPKDWTHGPFGWTPGIEISLRRTEG